eukprot:COSAG06_NODE_1488_length_9290_cov_4.140899_8_plen_547_part_00
MPDIAFHISSQTAHANGYCPGDDKTKIIMPVDPAIQVPNTAKPVVWLHNLAFDNTIANVRQGDGSNQITLRTGSSACTFYSGGTYKPFVGIKYTQAIAGTTYNFALVAPLTGTEDHKLTRDPPAGPGANGSFYYGQPETLDGMTVAQVYAAINTCFEKALGGANTKYLSDSRQNLVVTDDGGTRVPSAAVSIGGKAQLVNVAIPGSGAGGLVKYDSTGAGTGAAVSVSAELVNAAAAADLTTQSFEFMTSAEINAHINAVFGTTATYTVAKSIFDALGGGPTGATGSNLTFADRNSLGGNATVHADPKTTFGLYQDDTTTTTVTLGIDAYELPDFERAIAAGAKADSAFWAAANSHLPTTKPNTILVNPSANDARYAKEVTAAESGDPGPSNKLYAKLVSLKADVGADRVILQCAPNVEVVGGGLPTKVLGFSASQLGFATEGPKELKAANAAHVDRTRAVLFHAPGISAGSYSTEGKRGGSALAMVPIDVEVGATQSWEAKVPVKIPSNVAGSNITHLTVMLSNEDGEQLSFMGDRWSAQLILSF